jgi:AraC-like DNA-binding protein
METFLTSLNIAGLVLSLFFITLILTKKNKQLRDYLLVFFIYLLGTYLLIKYVFQYDLYNTYPIIVYLDICYWVLLGPTLYIYTLVSTKGENHLKASYLYTLIPAFLVTICFSEYIFNNPADLFNDWNNRSTIVEIGIYVWLYNSPVFYILTIITLLKHKKRIKNHFSYSRKVDLKWLFYLSNGFALFILFIILRGPAYWYLGWDFKIDNYSLSMAVVFVYIFGIGYFGYRQPGIFGNYVADVNPGIGKDVKIITENGNGKNHLSYQKSGLGNQEAQEIIGRLEGIMVSEQLYLDSELNLVTLAHKTNVSTHKLSQVINEYLDKNFFDFVSEYRIENVKNLLTHPENNQLKIVSLAFDSGFNSKSSFYKLFKKAEGITPAEYRKRNQKLAV